MATKMMEVKKETLVACMTCPLCDNLLDEATTISLCLHTFCRKCIYDKFSDEDVNGCPVCDNNLGAFPAEKLRADHNLQSLRTKIFPYKKRKEIAPDVTPSKPAPVKIKEKSLSSLVVSTPKVLIESGSTGKRSRSFFRKTASRGSCSDGNGKIEKKENSAKDDYPRNSAKKERQEHTLTYQRIGNVKGYNAEVKGRKIDLWKPLKCLAEAISKSKSFKGNTQGPSYVASVHLNNDNGLLAATKGNGDSSNAGVSQVYTSRKKFKEPRPKRKVADESNGSDLLPGHAKRRKIHAASWKKEDVSQEMDADDGTNESRRNVPNESRRNVPVWFALVAAKDQKRDVSLPQISSRYLRIKDSSMPVSFIQKYLAGKLNLSSESEVEIMCRDQQVVPTMQLHSLVDLWFRTTSASRRIPVSVGVPANDFIMVLSYCRKVPTT